MDRLKKIEKKLSHKEEEYIRESKLLVKHSEEYESLEEVFNKPTLMSIYKLMNKKVIKWVNGIISSGKESRVYYAMGWKGELALKIYLTTSLEFKKGLIQYLMVDPRFPRIRHDTFYLVKLWAKKEYTNLKEMYSKGVPVPKPIALHNNVLVMEFIGKDGLRAPLLREASLSNPQKIYFLLLNAMEKMVREVGLVHGDLSEYNVMILDDSIYIIDVSQAVPITLPISIELLKRDIRNINNYFAELGVEIISDEEILRRCTEVE